MKKSRCFLVLIAALLLSNCSTERAGCEGEIIVENPIPDTTLYVGGESFVRDISEPPVVFRHTLGKDMTLSRVDGDLDIVSTSTGISDKTGRRHLIIVEPKAEGETQIIIGVTDECPEYEVNTTFNVTVLDTTQQ